MLPLIPKRWNVVICFQILTFAVSATANGAHTFLAAQL